MFQRAVFKNSNLRLAVMGPTGAGKTYYSLVCASQFGRKIALIDSEHHSSEKYARKFSFDVANLETFAPVNYIRAMQEAAAAGYDVLIIDSLSHAWNGAGGCLEMVDKVATRSKSGNNFTAWREVTPEHNRLVESVLAYPGHVICTFRMKTEYVIEKNEGKTQIRKVGLAPVQRDGIEYEFDLVAEMDQDHNFWITKTRFEEFDQFQQGKNEQSFHTRLVPLFSNGNGNAAAASTEKDPPPPAVPSAPPVSSEPYLNAKPNKDFMRFMALGSAYYGRGEAWDKKRKELSQSISGGKIESSRDLPQKHLLTLIKGISDKINEEIENILSMIDGGPALSKAEPRLKMLFASVNNAELQKRYNSLLEQFGGLPF